VADKGAWGSGFQQGCQMGMLISDNKSKDKVKQSMHKKQFNDLGWFR